MKKLIRIPFAATLATALCIGGLARGQNSETSAEADGGKSPAVAPASPDALPDPESLPPAAAAFVYYFRIQTALAQDSLTNVVDNALAFANAVRKDTSGAFLAQLPAQAIALARDAITLPGARLDFAILSGQLMSYLKVKNPPEGIGPIHQVYDPVFTKLYWLQQGVGVQNPYLGKSPLPIGTYRR